jgi:NADPH:quinone reductase
VTGFAVGERVVTFSATGAGGYASIYVAGFNAGSYIPTHPPEVRPAAEAALKAVAAGLGQTEIEVLPFADAVTAHQRKESRDLNGRIVLTPNSRS